ncbi:MAG: hypothetical protein NC395_01330 [Prevotella sp.]|nr:hypothetical protein [Prevotella sp.]
MVSDFADETAYNEVIEKIRYFYPHCEYAETLDENSRTKTIIVPNKRGNPAAVRVEIDFKKSRTVVTSEAYLKKIFGGKKIRPVISPKEAAVKLIISAAFLFVNIALMQPITDLFIFIIFMPWVLLLYIAMLAAVYFTAAWSMRKTGISSAEIFFIEIGGLPLVLLIAVKIFGTSNLDEVFTAVNYIKYVLPVALIGVLIASAVTWRK